jgi:hypothetical protein
VPNTMRHSEANKAIQLSDLRQKMSVPTTTHTTAEATLIPSRYVAKRSMETSAASRLARTVAVSCSGSEKPTSES